MTQPRPRLRQVLVAGLVAGIFGLFTRTFLVQVNQIPSVSMEPGLLVGDLVLVNKFLFGAVRTGGEAPGWLPMRPLRLGDVVTFSRRELPGVVFVKRCVAQPGDTVRLERGQVWLNGRQLVLGDRVLPDRSSMPSTTLPLDRYFVLGDHRARSQDSRVWGGIPRGSVIGRPFLIYGSFAPDSPPRPPSDSAFAPAAEEWGKIEPSSTRDSGRRRFRWDRCLEPVR